MGRMKIHTVMTGQRTLVIRLAQELDRRIGGAMVDAVMEDGVDLDATQDDLEARLQELAARRDERLVVANGGHGVFIWGYRDLAVERAMRGGKR